MCSVQLPGVRCVPYLDTGRVEIDVERKVRQVAASIGKDHRECEIERGVSQFPQVRGVVAQTDGRSNLSPRIGTRCLLPVVACLPSPRGKPSYLVFQGGGIQRPCNHIIAHHTAVGPQHLGEHQLAPAEARGDAAGDRGPGRRRTLLLVGEEGPHPPPAVCSAGVEDDVPWPFGRWAIYPCHVVPVGYHLSGVLGEEADFKGVLDCSQGLIGLPLLYRPPREERLTCVWDNKRTECVTWEVQRLVPHHLPNPHGGVRRILQSSVHPCQETVGKGKAGVLDERGVLHGKGLGGMLHVCVADDNWTGLPEVEVLQVAPPVYQGVTPAIRHVCNVRRYHHHHPQQDPWPSLHPLPPPPPSNEVQ
eukprot:Sspe_Gene.56240::Locus_30944_Transcript_1_1_Confidence_1.000_Length_1360::g.56240::m.56240